MIQVGWRCFIHASTKMEIPKIRNLPMQLHRCNNLVLIFPRVRSINLDRTTFGQNRNGDASMYGLGVRDSDVLGAIPSRSACRRENVQLKAQCEELMVKLQAQEELNGSRDGSSVQPSSSYCQVVTDGPPCLRVGDEVFLKSILNLNEIVARGWVSSLEPNDIVGGMEIGCGWC